MKHLKRNRKFSREKKQREALIKTMLGSLFSKGKITTTLAKAKELKMISEKIVSQLKTRNNLRSITSRLPRNIDQKTTESIKIRTESRKSGFFRITRLAPRLSDGAKIARIEFVDNLIEKTPKKDEEK